MSTLEEITAQETELKEKLDQTKKIDERRKVRADLRALRAKKEKLANENSNEKKPTTSTVSSSPTVLSMNTRSTQFDYKVTNYIEQEPVTINIARTDDQPKVARSTFKFEMKSARIDTESRKYQINQYNGVEEKRPRINQDLNNNNQESMQTSNSAAPKRMSRRASLVELFKLEEDNKGGVHKGRLAQPDIPDGAKLAVNGPPSSRSHVAKSDDQTKQDLLQNLGRLRSRRRSVREIQNRDELEGLMYVKQGDVVKLVSTTKGDEEVKEERRVRRSSRREMQEKMKIDGNLIKKMEEKDEVLSPVKEESLSPGLTNQRFKYGNTAMNRAEPPKQDNRPPYNNNKFGRNESPQPGRFGRPGAAGPKSFLAGKEEESSAPAKLSGSVADRMKYFRQQAELEKKQASKQMPVYLKKAAPPSPRPAHTPTPTPTPPTPTSNETKDRVSLKKAPDPNKAPRELKKKPQLKRQMSVSSLILTWCKDVTAGYAGVNIKNFSGSFANGLAFCALFHKFHPEKFDFDSLDATNREFNVKLAFRTGV
ncbi:hypothetical protein QZH41_012386 [Actinostola sp. cb2023]|nr:hypothetical protein QZH41_012386 [Actinostola sp. cb2023]